MRRTVQRGWLAGEEIHRARKAGRCQYWLGKAGRCPNRIEVGGEYVYGEPVMFNNPFERERWCLDHLHEDGDSQSAPAS